MEGVVIIICVVVLLFIGMRFLAGSIYGRNDKDADIRPALDAWGRVEGTGPKYTPPDKEKEKRERAEQIRRKAAEEAAIREERKAASAKAFYQSPEWRSLRYAAIKKYGGACSACGRTASKHGIVIHVDHIKPRSKYPELALRLDNLQLLCNECNCAKGNRDEIKWR
ncbi:MULTISPECIES: HNH endonuclease [Pseudocitrobacter]|uniref:HNHc domain-containing protein n=1 Tax=Pseudocitrobacter vendiensis TaxID=2488306 RepID=A0ABM9F9R5_9ENTR|nr:HNH endonuclease signature motif containing protein [Pseudocitrobacter vendiensis]CAH6659897.1 HNHc domain-containing protein [Pseudocitrobacter vendiensis]